MVNDVLPYLINVRLHKSTLRNFKPHIKKPLLKLRVHKLLLLDRPHKPIDLLGSQQFTFIQNLLQPRNRNRPFFSLISQLKPLLQNLIWLSNLIHIHQLHRLSINLHILLLSLLQHLIPRKERLDRFNSNRDELLPANLPIWILISQRNQSLHVIVLQPIR